MATETPHHWYSPSELATRLDARPAGDGWRARCPAHAGDNPAALSIREGVSADGTPLTLLHCFVADCDIAAICAALAIPLAGLWCVRPDAPRRTRENTRSVARTVQTRAPQAPLSRDDIAEILLCEMIPSDPQWFWSCQGAQETCWRLGLSVPRRFRLSAAFAQAGWRVADVWHRLTREGVPAAQVASVSTMTAPSHT